MATPPTERFVPGDPGRPRAPVPARSWYTLFVLMLGYVLCLMDRKLPFILVEPIRHDLGLSDTQIGLLTGLVFTLVYSTSAIPVARIADKYSRKWVLTTSVLVWSALTSAGGFAQNFWQLAGARAGVAIGESGAMPSSHSMINDLFPEHRRATAASIFMAGAPIGILIGMAAGGIISDLFDWRTAMIVLGAPGLMLGLLLAFTVREPKRAAVPKGAPKVGMLQAGMILFALPTFRHLAFAAMLSSLAGTAAQSFGPAFMMRNYGLSTTETGISYGLVLGLGGLLGALMGGVVADRLRRLDERAGIWFVSAVIAFAAPFQVFCWFAPTYGLFLALMFIPQISTMIYAGPVYPALQALAGPQMRAMAVAFYLFLLNGVGQSLGPLVTGMLSDGLRSRFGEDSLQISLFILGGLKLWSALHYVLAAVNIRKDLAHARVRLASSEALAT